MTFRERFGNALLASRRLVQHERLFNFMRKIQDLTSQKFGKLTLIKIYDKDRHKNIRWLCKCDCGVETVVISNILFNKKVESCGCLNHQRGKKSRHFKGYEEIHKTFWNSITKGAKRRGLLFALTMEEVWDLFIKQGRKCAISGLPLRFKDKSIGSDGTASLDRIDSAKPYTIDNVQWTHKDINIMKQSYPQEIFIQYCKSIAEYNK